MRFFQLYQTYFLFLLIVISTNSYSNQTTMGELLQKTFEFITKNKTPEETKDQQDLITTKFSRGENLTPGDFCYLFFDSNPKNFENIDLINNIMNQLLLVQKVEDVSDLPDYLQILEPQRSKKDPALESSLLEYFVSLIEEDSDSFIALLSYYAGRYGEYPISEECRKKALKTTLLQVLPKKEDINPEEKIARLKLQATYVFTMTAVTMFNHNDTFPADRLNKSPSTGWCFRLTTVAAIIAGILFFNQLQIVW